jgi:Na+-transporting methylmalonyl-CoA/oxaloacetate decarboxylase gamma subunit
MAENFRLSLQVAVLGMGLVILTLLIIAAIIMLLGRIFRPKPEIVGTSARPADGQDVTCDTPTLAPATTNLNDEATAIALAITLQRGRRKAPRMLPKVAYTDTEVIGEVVNVVSIEPGAGVWAGVGRLQSSK